MKRIKRWLEGGALGLLAVMLVGGMALSVPPPAKANGPTALVQAYRGTVTCSGWGHLMFMHGSSIHNWAYYLLARGFDSAEGVVPSTACHNLHMTKGPIRG